MLKQQLFEGHTGTGKEDVPRLMKTNTVATAMC